MSSPTAIPPLATSLPDVTPIATASHDIVYNRNSRRRPKIEVGDVAARAVTGQKAIGMPVAPHSFVPPYEFDVQLVVAAENGFWSPFQLVPALPAA